MDVNNSARCAMINRDKCSPPRELCRSFRYTWKFFKSVNISASVTLLLSHVSASMNMLLLYAEIMLDISSSFGRRLRMLVNRTWQGGAVWRTNAGCLWGECYASSLTVFNDVSNV